MSLGKNKYLRQITGYFSIFFAIAFSVYIFGGSRERVGVIPAIYYGRWGGESSENFLRINIESIYIGARNNEEYHCSTEEIYTFAPRLAWLKDTGIFAYCDIDRYSQSSFGSGSLRDLLSEKDRGNSTIEFDIYIKLVQRDHGDTLMAWEVVDFLDRPSISTYLGTFYGR